MIRAAEDGAVPRSNGAGRGMGVLCLVVALAACAGGGGGSGGSGQCNDGSWCGDRLDRDQDNLISPQEWDDAFNAADTDHDGVVSQTEFEAAGGSWAGGAVEAARPELAPGNSTADEEEGS